MGRSYETIIFLPEQCNGCMDCQTACAQAKAGQDDPVHSRIGIVTDSEGKDYGLALCRQCERSACIINCPGGALHKNPETGVVEWDEFSCVGCQTCTMVCPYAGITFNNTTRQVMKCDMCQGDPACVRACKTGALKVSDANKIYNQWGDMEDLFVPGISACLGCNSELVIRHTLRRIGPNTVVATPPGCVAGVGAVGVNGITATKTPVFHPLLTNTAAMLAGVKRYYNRIGREVTMLAFAGDGGTADVGFQSFSGAAERGEQMIYICIDNEGYMNTGVQRSSTTPYGAWTSTTPVGKVLKGKSRDPKSLPLLMVMHHCEYVATASTAFMEDYYRKLDKALEASKRGMTYIHIFSPCPTGWRFPPNQLIEVGRKAVQTNLVPLWEYDNRDQAIQFTHPVDSPLPVSACLSLIGKFRHIDQEQVAHIQERANEGVAMLKRLTGLKECTQPHAVNGGFISGIRVKT